MIYSQFFSQLIFSSIEAMEVKGALQREGEKPHKKQRK